MQTDQTAAGNYGRIFHQILERSSQLNRAYRDENERSSIVDAFGKLTESVRRLFPVNEKAFQRYGLPLLQIALEAVYERSAGTGESREERILNSQPLVKRVWEIMKPVIGPAPFVSDMESHGLIGLIEGLDNKQGRNPRDVLPYAVLNIGAQMMVAAKYYGYAKVAPVVVRNQTDIKPKRSHARGGLEADVLELLASQIKERF